MNTKTNHVAPQPQSRRHACRWPECPEQVPLAMWACRAHWFTLPAPLRMEIWRTYRPGQADTRTYINAAQRALDWIAQYGGNTP